MTPITRKLTRLTAAKVRGVPLVAECTPHEVTLREFGSRRGYSVPWAAIYELGGKLKAREDEREKRAGRKAS
jgi:hypothetical protein